jgi:hypothetical protein
MSTASKVLPSTSGRRASVSSASVRRAEYQSTVGRVIRLLQSLRHALVAAVSVSVEIDQLPPRRQREVALAWLRRG